MKKKIFYVLIALLAVTFFSCAPVAEIVISPQGDVTIDIAVQPSAHTETIIQTIVGKDKALFDATEITKNLKTENIQTTKLETNAPATVNGKFYIPAHRVKESSLFSIDIKAKTVTCNIHAESVARLVDTFPEDVKEYLELLVSPILTGDIMSASEYQELIATAYGPKIAGELDTAFFKVTLTCPGIVDSVKSEPEGRVHYFTGNSATITVPLSYMLSLEKPLLITVTYK